MNVTIRKAFNDGWKSVPAAVLLSITYIAVFKQNIFGAFPSGGFYALGALLGGMWASTLALLLNSNIQQLESRGWELSQPISRSNTYWGRMLAAVFLFLLAIIPCNAICYSFLACYFPYHGPLSPFTCAIAYFIGAISSFAYYAAGVWIRSLNSKWFLSRLLPMTLPLLINILGYIVLFNPNPNNNPLILLSLLLTLLYLSVIWGAKNSYEHLSNTPSRLLDDSSHPILKHKAGTAAHIIGLSAASAIVTSILSVALILSTSRERDYSHTRLYRKPQVTDSNNLLVYDFQSTLSKPRPSDNTPPPSESIDIRRVEVWKPNHSNSDGIDNENSTFASQYTGDIPKALSQEIVQPTWKILGITTKRKYRPVLQEQFTPIYSQTSAWIQNDSIATIPHNQPDKYYYCQDTAGFLYIYENIRVDGKVSMKLLSKLGRNGLSNANEPFTPQGLHLAPVAYFNSLETNGEQQQWIYLVDNNGLYTFDSQSKTLTCLVSRSIDYLVFLPSDSTTTYERLLVKGKEDISLYRIKREDSSRDLITSLDLDTTTKIPEDFGDSSGTYFIQKTRMGKLKLLAIDYASRQSTAVDVKQSNDDYVKSTLVHYKFVPKPINAESTAVKLSGLFFPPALCTSVAYVESSTHPTDKWYLAIGMVLQVALSLPLTLKMSRHRKLSKKDTFRWVFPTALLGWATPIAIAAIHPRVASVTCRGCNKSIRADDEECPHCNSNEFVSSLVTSLPDSVRIA